MTEISTSQLANAIRVLSMDAVQAAKSGHPGMPMGFADVATMLFTKFLKFDASAPTWADRDRFVLSAGHGSMLIYALLHLCGYTQANMASLRNFRQWQAPTAGHPEYGHLQGIETTTGPLGQGLATAVGMAIGERVMQARFGEALVDHYTYVVAGDGCLMEGISHEAISLAGHLGLNKLIVLWDNNAISIDGPTDLSVSDNQLARFRACGWDVQDIDGHDPAQIDHALTQAQQSPKPALIACKTIIGYGAPNKAGTAAVHGAPLGEAEIAGVRQKLNWPHPPFHIPTEIAEAWHAFGHRSHQIRRDWEARLDALSPTKRQAFENSMAGILPAGWEQAITAVKKQASAEKPKIATRVSSQKTLAALSAVLPELIGGSADLTGSNNTKTERMSVIAKGDFGGNYIHYGVREHAMAAAMNGLALHGGIVPYGGTFLVFTDYCRPAMRLSALMGLRVIYVMTHDSIGLGEDGPTHQPIEHLASLRAMPNMYLYRPCDTVETAECWALAIQQQKAPAVLALSRQGLATLRGEHHDENLCAQGAYILANSHNGQRDVTLMASGSEVEIILEAQSQLQADDIGCVVVSVPCLDVFAQQSEDYQRQVLGTNGGLRLAVEAGVRQGWDQFIGPHGTFIGLEDFGASAPAPTLYKAFGLTVEAVVTKVKKFMSQ